MRLCIAWGRSPRFSKPRVSHNQRHGILKRCSFRNASLIDPIQVILLPIPLPHFGLAILGGLRFVGVAAKRLFKRNIKVEKARDSAVIAMERAEHIAVVIPIENAIENDVVSVIERIASRQIDQSDVRSPRSIMLAQNDPPQIVLPNNRNPTSEPIPNTLSSCTFAGRRIPAEHNQPRFGCPYGRTHHYPLISRVVTVFSTRLQTRIA